ncbi:hypothetical protein [Devosia sp. MC521]|uniref:hypothetical protein n=1 Tax=Devosia sp. MC521 TaxID=2759954 RepID=UPI0015FC40DC|nr:hypothetical protein [Devosia sp. MC521]MBJ6989188.1 hypothetical protein [Devosia sp. MC521]QMW62457.1 hypothetical protein H4N61_16320 [Devosia sp. MC521]
MKAFIDEAHRRSSMVLFDVVYNHFGPLGNNLPDIRPIFTTKHKSPRGEEINFDGLRFDAVHTIVDDTPTHILELLAARIRASPPHRHTHLIVENSDNQEVLLRPNSSAEPVHYTAQWNDDVHHLLHAAATEENTRYYADFDDFEGRSSMLGRALAEEFAYQGEMKPHAGMKRDEPSGGLPATSFVVYMQDHDQVGNRVKGDGLPNWRPAMR